jgi:glyoxylate/hydroxypyruvate reductase A
MKTLILTDPIPARTFTESIRAIAPDASLVEYTRQMSDAELADIEIVLGWRFPDGVVQRLPKLKWVCSIAAGVEKLLVPELPAHIPVSRIVDAEQAEGIAQFVALMALRHARALTTYEALQRERSWTRQGIGAVRSRVAVLGMGTMGAAVARLLGVVGFEVRGWSRSQGGALDALLASSDIVVCALPLTPETDSMFDAKAFAAMPKGSYLINIARGAHVVEPDLIEAVRSGHLGGAALDVQRNEPMASDDPLWSVPGITITPHIAAQASRETTAAQFVAGLRCLERGDSPPQQVDRVRGY